VDLHKVAVKFFATDPSAVRLDEFIPVFHRWIQKHAVEGMLIDVADYGHLPQGPGVVLVAHEADYSIDSSEGPFGLLYNRKISTTGRLSDRIAAAFKAALGACVKLETEPEFQGRLKFRAGEALVVANDRLNAPNTEEGFQALRSDLAAALSKVYPSNFDMQRISLDDRERLTIQVSSREPVPDVASLLANLG
jgi:septum formation topological specificity factor MinE